MMSNQQLNTITLPVLTWSSMVDKKTRPIGMFECMTTGILWLWGEDNEG